MSALRPNRRRKSRPTKPRKLTSDDVLEMHTSDGMYDYSTYTSVDRDAYHTISYRLRNRDLDLSGLTTYPPGLAHAVATAMDHNGHHSLYLDSVESLDPEVAWIISHSYVDVSLDSLPELSAEHVDVLSLSYDPLHESTGRSYSFAGVRELTTSLARKLAYHTTGLYLDGITDVSDDLAAALCYQRNDPHDCDGQKVEVNLSLSGVQTLATPPLRQLLRKSGTLTLSGLDHIPDTQISLLWGRKCGLILAGLRSLPGELSSALAYADGMLSLGALTRLSEKDAIELSRHAGHLRLNRITHLSDAAWTHLLKLRGQLELRGIRELSPSVVDGIRARTSGDLPDRGLILSDHLTLQLLQDETKVASNVAMKRARKVTR